MQLSLGNKTPHASRETASNDTSACFGPDFANSSRFRSAPFQRRPVNRSTGPRFHSMPFHRLKSPKTGSRATASASAFAKSPQPAGPASGPCRIFCPHIAPKSVRPLPLRASRSPCVAPKPPKRSYPFGLYRRSSSCGGDPQSGGFGLHLTALLASKTAFCSVEWKFCGQPMNHRGKAAPPTVVTVTLP